MKIKTVYLDLDGVLADFIKGIHRALSIPYDYDNYPYEMGKWSMLNDGELNYPEINAICTSDFWATLDWMPDGKSILTGIEEFFAKENIYLLTAPMPNIESPTGKWRWVKEHIPDYYERTIITCAPKFLLAKPDTLLIDDRDKNVNDFREAGGQAVLVNRMWNSGYKEAIHTLSVFCCDLLSLRLKETK